MAAITHPQWAFTSFSDAIGPKKQQEMKINLRNKIIAAYDAAPYAEDGVKEITVNDATFHAHVSPYGKDNELRIYIAEPKRGTGLLDQFQKCLLSEIAQHRAQQKSQPTNTVEQIEQQPLLEASATRSH